MTETFQIRQDLNFFELANAIAYQISKTKMIRRFFIFLFVLIIASFFLGLSTTSPQGESLFIFLARLISPILAIPILFLAIPISMAIILKIIRPNHFTNVTYYFNNWGMRKIGRGIEFSRPWNMFLRAEESRHFIFLYITEIDAHIIQKRFFENSDAIEHFRELVHYHLGGK